MCNDGATNIFEDLPTAGVVPMVVTVEEILDRLIGDALDSLNHRYCMLGVDRFNDHDSFASQDEHRDIPRGRSEAVDSIRYFISLREHKAKGEYLEKQEILENDHRHEDTEEL